MRNLITVFLALYVAAQCGGCGKVQDKLLEIDPEHVVKQFFEAWKKNDWKTLYAMSDPGFMQKLRTQKLSPELRKMSDQDLFIHEFRQAQRLNPDKVVRSYEIVYVQAYKKGDTTISVDVLVNGKKRKIPLNLDGLSLKVDLTRIE